MNCIYRCTEISRLGKGRPYLERYDTDLNVTPLFPDDTIYVTLLDDRHYSVTNQYNEVFCIGNTGVKGIDEFLSRIKYNAVIVNGDDYQEYLTEKEKEKEQANEE